MSSTCLPGMRFHHGISCESAQARESNLCMVAQLMCCKWQIAVVCWPQCWLGPAYKLRANYQAERWKAACCCVQAPISMLPAAC